MFDLTKEIKLEPKWQKVYQRLRILVCAALIFGFLYLGYLSLFLSARFLFSFAAPSSKNNLNDPRNSQNAIIKNGEIKKGEGLVFDAFLSASEGNFSEVEININLGKNSPLIQNGNITIMKSYQSFFYPLGEPTGFKDGDLVKNKENYYLVSQGKLRRFANAQVMKNLGFGPDNFEEAGEKELEYNPPGENISDAQNYPDDTLIKIGDNYYQFKDKKLYAFISPNAYLSRHSGRQTIKKDNNFLEKYEIAEDKLGFASGALLSYGQSVFIVSGNEILPINSPAAFESRGFYWDDIIPASSEEIGIYEKGKLFTADRPDPNGTVFTDRESGKYYLVRDSVKREIIGSPVIKSYFKKNPILVDEKGLLKENGCQMKEKFSLFGKSYSCVIAIENLSQIPGNDYRFESVFSPDIKIKELKVVFCKTIDWNNLRSVLAEIKTRIISHYYGQPQ